MEFTSDIGIIGGMFFSGTVAYGAVVAALIVFIIVRRLVRARHFGRRDQRAYEVRQQWRNILRGSIPAEAWRRNALDREVVETILLDSIEAAQPGELPPLLKFLRSSGLLDLRLHEARSSAGWKRRAALVALGRTRTREAVAPLVDALDSSDVDIRTAAVRGLGEISLPEAAIPLLERLATGHLDVSPAVVSSAIVQCCRQEPRTLLCYFHLTQGTERELLARVLAEADIGSLGEELISLSTDKSPEVRASAARGLPKLDPSISIPLLTDLTADSSWFVRLRAVVSLGAIDSKMAVEPLVHALRDSNRLVRQRAAAALVRRSGQLREIVEDAIALKDDYGLQALLSELERAGESEPMLRSFRESRRDDVAGCIETARKGLDRDGRESTRSAGAR